MLLALGRSHFRNVLLLTVNYDTLLEGAIRRVFHHEFRTMGDYRWSEEDGRQWALVKLHGSTTWGRRLRCKAGAERWADLVGGLTDLDMDPEFIPLESHQGQHRLVGGHYCYPAIALPAGRATSCAHARTWSWLTACSGGRRTSS